jgi:hypothetical protein
MLKAAIAQSELSVSDFIAATMNIIIIRKGYHE